MLDALFIVLMIIVAGFCMLAVITPYTSQVEWDDNLDDWDDEL